MHLLVYSNLLSLTERMNGGVSHFELAYANQLLKIKAGFNCFLKLAYANF